MHTNFTRRVWQRAIAAAKLPDDLRIHDLRHTCASLLIAEGANIKALQQHLGHSSATVTLDRYGHLYPDDLDALSDALERRRAGALAGQPRDRDGTRGAETPVDLRQRLGGLADS